MRYNITIFQIDFDARLTCVMESPNKITLGQITVFKLDIMNFQVGTVKWLH